MAAVFSCLLVGNRVTKAEAWDNLLACIPFSEKKLNELPESINLLISELVAQRVLLIGELEQLQLSLDAAFGEEEPEEEEEEEEQN